MNPDDPAESTETPEPVTHPPQQRNPEWWPTAQALRIQGVEIKEIAKQLNVKYPALRKRFERAGMSHIDKHILQRTVTITREASAAAMEVAKHSLRPMLHKLAREIGESKPVQTKPRTLGQAEQKARVLHTVTQAAKVLEGWQDTSEKAVSVELLSTVQADASPVPPAIDVPSVPSDPV